jgi:intraflagellar transport protein 140
MITRCSTADCDFFHSVFFCSGLLSISITFVCAFSLSLPRVDVQGTVKKVLPFAESEGQPIGVDVFGDCLAVVTTTSHVKVWDVSRREPKQLLPGRTFDAAAFAGASESANSGNGNSGNGNSGNGASGNGSASNSNGSNAIGSGSGSGSSGGVCSIRSVRVNCKGTKLSLLLSRIDDAAAGTGMLEPDARLFVYDVETDALQPYGFGPHYYPIAHFWDPREPKLLAVQSRRFENGASSSSASSSSSSSSDASSSSASSVAYAVASSGSGSGAGAGSGSSEFDESVRRPEGEVTMLFATADFGVKLQVGV